MATEPETIDGAAVEEHEQDEARTYVAPEAGTSLERRPVAEMEMRGGLSVDDVVARVAKVREIADKVMQEGEDYGLIPGVSKPSLFKPGAEVLCMAFELDPETVIEREDLDRDGHLDVVAKTTLFHIPTGLRVASGIGSCTTRETRYAFRQAQRECPECGQETVFKSKKKPGEWFCWAKKGGCGANFDAGSEEALALADVDVSRKARPREELADSYNTVRKMASKRSLVDAVLRATGASRIYTQDVEDTSPETAPEPVRREGPPPMAVPKTFATISKLLENYDVDLGWPEWSRQASVLVLGEGDYAKLSRDQRKVLLQKSAGALVALFDLHPPSQFPPPDAAVIRRAWATVLDGAVLEGPPDDVGTSESGGEAGATPESADAAGSAEEGAGRAGDGSPEEAEADRIADEVFGPKVET